MKCPTCIRPRQKAHIMCGWCWSKVTADTQSAIWQASQKVRDLWSKEPRGERSPELREALRDWQKVRQTTINEVAGTRFTAAHPGRAQPRSRP